MNPLITPEVNFLMVNILKLELELIKLALLSFDTVMLRLIRVKTTILTVTKYTKKFKF